MRAQNSQLVIGVFLVLQLVVVLSVDAQSQSAKSSPSVAHETAETIDALSKDLARISVLLQPHSVSTTKPETSGTLMAPMGMIAHERPDATSASVFAIKRGEFVTMSDQEVDGRVLSTNSNQEAGWIQAVAPSTADAVRRPRNEPARS
jgi:hypothetical protein